MLPARQIGSNGTEATNVPEHTRDSSASAASRLGDVLEHLDGQHEVERVVGERQRGGVAEHARQPAASRHPRRASSSGRSTPTSGTPGKRSRTRDITWPSPTPISRMRRGASPASISSSALMNPRIIRCSIGFVVAYLS